jgi:hypothetical protein
VLAFSNLLSWLSSLSIIELNSAICANTDELDSILDTGRLSNCLSMNFPGENEIFFSGDGSSLMKQAGMGRFLSLTTYR